jgi:hypothetical protein
MPLRLRLRLLLQQVMNLVRFKLPLHPLQQPTILQPLEKYDQCKQQGQIHLLLLLPLLFPLHSSHNNNLMLLVTTVVIATTWVA